MSCLSGFPITTGGIWIDRPGHYFIEPSDLGIPVIVVTAYVFILWIILAEKFELDEKNIIFYYSLKIWHLWKKEVDNRRYRALLAGSPIARALVKRLGIEYLLWI